MRYFARGGFGPDFRQPDGTGANLAVWDTENPQLRSELHQLVRRWLADEYAAVKAALKAHRPLLDATAQALLRDPVQDQAELQALWERYGQPDFSSQP
jgi:ATP-dependent Zn protease